jgi:hypothetical protein
MSGAHSKNSVRYYLAPGKYGSPATLVFFSANPKDNVRYTCAPEMGEPAEQASRKSTAVNFSSDLTALDGIRRFVGGLVNGAASGSSLEQSHAKR